MRITRHSALCRYAVESPAASGVLQLMDKIPEDRQRHGSYAVILSDG